MKSINIQGVRVDEVTMDQAVDQVAEWIKGSGKHYIVTPNVEFVIKAQEDPEFKQILNKADMAIPDSSHLKRNFPVVTGTDLMDRLCKEAVIKGWTVGLIGGSEGVAEKTAQMYPGLKVVIAQSGGQVAEDGTGGPSITQKMDLLFVAFGQGKQEKWISRHLRGVHVKVAMGVGGAFDYLSGSVRRAPLWMRKLGLEWVFRLMVQPWRIGRIYKILTYEVRVYLLGNTK